MAGRKQLIATDLQPGTRIAHNRSVFEIAQVNLFRTPEGKVLGGVVFPRTVDPRWVKGYWVRSILHNYGRTSLPVTVS